MFIPLDQICIDKSILRLYGQGGRWINMELPMYIALDHKSESDWEMHNVVSSRSIMIQLRLGKSVEVYENHTSDDELLHGIQVLNMSVALWTNSTWIVCADSYFASVGFGKESKTIQDGN